MKTHLAKNEAAADVPWDAAVVFMGTVFGGPDRDTGALTGPIPVVITSLSEGMYARLWGTAGRPRDERSAMFAFPVAGALKLACRWNQQKIINSLGVNHKRVNTLNAH